MRAVTGIKPTGAPHLGNLLGAIEPALRLQADHDAFYFIADYHALTTLHDRERMRQYTYDVVATWLALGLDPERTTIFVQSDVPETCELAWYLGCMAGLGLLERGHAYKDAREKGKEVSGGLFYYPVLMAADIVLYDANVVPVGKDQKQHIEMTRDMVHAFNARFGEVLVVPDPLIQEQVATVPGLDGRKMSKSYDNGIEVFLPAKQLRKKVMSITTDSKGMDEPKDPDTCNVFNLYKLLATPEQTAALADRYRAGGQGYGHAKQELYEVLEGRLGPARERYLALLADPSQMNTILAHGATRARRIAQATMSRVRDACGQTSAPRMV